MFTLALSASFEYICYGLRPLEMFQFFSAGTDYGRQNLTSIDDTRTEKVNDVPTL